MKIVLPVDVERENNKILERVTVRAMIFLINVFAHMDMHFFYMRNICAFQAYIH